MNHKKLSARIMSFVLSAAMTFTAFPATVFAAEAKAPQPTTTRTIIAFDELGDGFEKPAPFDGHTYEHKVELNTAFEEVKLPTELGVTVEKVTITPPAKDTTDSGEAAKDTTIIETAPEKIPVTWKGDKEYIATQSGKVIYTAVLPEGYAVKDSAKLPIINVMVGEKAMAAMAALPRGAKGATPVIRTTPLDFVANADITYIAADGSTQQTANPTLTSIKDTGEGWSWDLSSNTLTLSGATIDCSGNATVNEDTFGIKLNPNCNIILANGTTNTVKAGPSSKVTGFSYGIWFIAGDGSVTNSTISGKGTLDVTGGTAPGSYCTSYGIAYKNTTSTTLTVKDATIIAQSTESYYGNGIVATLQMQSGTITATGKSKSGSDECGISGKTLNMTGGTITAFGKNAISFTGRITAENPVIENGTADNGSFVSGMTMKLTQTDTTKPVIISCTPPTPVVKTRTTPLDLTKAGLFYLAADGKTQQTANPTTTSINDTGEGWSWDCPSKTLTLSGANIDCSGNPVSSNETCGIRLLCNYNIFLTEGTTSTVKAGDSSGNYRYSYGVYFADEGSVASIGGKGTLNTMGGNVTGTGCYSCGISTNASLTLTISDATIIAASANATTYNCGIWIKNLKVQSGTITATGTGSGSAYGIYGETFTMTGGTLSASGKTNAVNSFVAPIIAANAIVTNGAADNSGGEFKSGVTKTLTQKNSSAPVVITLPTPSISFDARNGVDISDVEVGDAMTLPADPASWNGYTFDGWYDGIDGTDAAGGLDGKLDLTKAKALTASTTVYAKWTKGGKAVRTTPLDLSSASVTPAPDQGWTWDSGTKKLTLDGLTIDSKGQFAIKLPDGATITASGTNNLTLNNIDVDYVADSNYKTVAVIDGIGELALNGTGTININSKFKHSTKSGSYTYGINSDTKLKIDGVTINIDLLVPTDGGGTTMGSLTGLKAMGSLEIGTITAPKINIKLGDSSSEEGIVAKALTIASGNVAIESQCGIITTDGSTLTGGILILKGEDAISDVFADGGLIANGATILGSKDDFTGTNAIPTLVSEIVDVKNTYVYLRFSFTKSVSFDARNGTITDVEIKGGTLAMPANPTWTGYDFGGWYTETDGKGTKFVNSGLTASTTVYAKWTKGGKAVRTTPLDLSTATTDQSGDGWAWNKDSKTLTLSGANIDCSGNAVTTGDKFGINLPADSKIILTPSTTSTVKAGDSSDDITISVYLNGDTSISGAGTLNVECDAVASAISFGISCEYPGTLTISEATINATLTKSDRGAAIAGKLDIKSGTITATATGVTAGFGINTSTMTMSGGTVTATGTGGTMGCGIGGEVLTMTGGTLYAKGTTYAVMLDDGDDSTATDVITAEGAKPTGAKETFTSGVTKNLTQKDASKPVVIGFGPSIAATTLAGTILDATNAKNGISANNGDPSSVPSGTKYVTNAEMKALTDAISAAQAVANKTNPAATDAELTAATATLNNAVNAFKAAIKTGTYVANGNSGNTGDNGSTGNSGGTGSTGSTGSTTNNTGNVNATAKPTIPVSGSTSTSATVDKNGNATVNVTNAIVENAIKAAVASANKKGAKAGDISVDIHVNSNGQNPNSISTNLPKSVQDMLVKENVAEFGIESETANLAFDNKALQQIRKQANGDATINASRADVSKLSKEAQNEIGNRPVFNLSITDKTGKNISDFGGGFATISIPYTLQPNENPNNLQAFFVDSKGKLHEVTCTYDPVTKCMVFVTNHFSVYAVGYNEKAPKFTDISNHWAKDSIEFVTARGLLNGSSKTKFSADSAITRKDFSAALAKFSGKNVSKMIKNSNENKPITRQEMSEILLQFTKGAGYKLPQTRAEIKFTDTKNEAVKAMQMAGVVMGKDGNKFDPTGTATKAQASAALRRLVELNLDKATAQGLDVNDSGKNVYYENGKLFTGKKTINGTTYNFGKDGISVKIDAAISDKKYITHKIVRGDSLWKLSKKYKCTVADITKLNDIKNPSKVPVGTEVLIPEK